MIRTAVVFGAEESRAKAEMAKVLDFEREMAKVQERVKRTEKVIFLQGHSRTPKIDSLQIYEQARDAVDNAKMRDQTTESIEPSRRREHVFRLGDLPKGKYCSKTLIKRVTQELSRKIEK